jgi:hypothetical protein
VGALLQVFPAEEDIDQKGGKRQERYQCITVHGLSLHLVHFVHMRRLFIPEERDNDGKSYRRLCCGYRDDKENKNMSPHVLQIMAEGDKADIHGVQHEFDRHEHDDNVPPRQEAEHADHEDRGAQRKVPV